MQCPFRIPRSSPPSEVSERSVCDIPHVLTLTRVLNDSEWQRLTSPVVPLSVIFYCAIGGALVSAYGLFAVVAYLRSDEAGMAKEDGTLDFKTPMGVKVYFVLIVLLSLVQFVVACMYTAYQNTLNDTQLKLTALENSSAAAQTMNDQHAAVFNRCCEERGWSVHGPVLPCTGDMGVDCAAYPSEVSDFLPQLCTCIGSQSVYDEAYALTSNATCDVFASTQIHIVDGTKIPGTDFDIRFIIKDVDVIPLVGNNAHPVYGCGYGFAKGFSWAHSQTLQQPLAPLYASSVALGLVNLGTVVAALSFAYSRTMVQTKSIYQQYQDRVEAASKAGMAFAEDDVDASGPAYDVPEALPAITGSTSATLPAITGSTSAA